MTRKFSSPKQALMAGAAWAIAMRWSIKGLGFVSTAVMARLLAPADYGIVAMAMLVVGLIQSLLDFGAATALMRKASVSRDEIDSAWTLRMIEGLLMGSLLMAAAYPAALYFQEPRVRTVLFVLAASVAFASTGNIGMTLATKSLNFSLEFRHAVVCKVLSVVITLAAGYWLRDYRALAIGVASGYVLGNIFSYVMHPYRPRWNTSRIPETWAVTKWLMFASMAGFVLRKGDELIAARLGTTRDYGLYNVGADLGQLPTGEVGPAILRAFLPVLSSIQGSAERTNGAVIKTLAAVSTLTFGLGITVAVFAQPLTLLALGPKWADAAIFVSIFALVSTLQILSSPLHTLLTLRGHTRVQSTITWIEFTAFLTSALLLAPSFGLLGLAYARCASAFLSFNLSATVCSRLCGLSLRATAVAAFRPLVCALVVYALLYQFVVPMPASGWLVAALAVASVVLYSACCALLWLAAGRPEGIESSVRDVVSTWWKQSRAFGAP